MTNQLRFSAILMLISSGFSIGQNARPVTPFLATGDGTIRALVIGVSDYESTEINYLPAARYDAETFAAFLRSGQSRRLTSEDLILLTDAQATAAAVLTSLDALLRESRGGDRLLVYFSGYGQHLTAENRPEATYLQFYDSPKAPVQAGSLPLSTIQHLLENAAAEKGLRYVLALELRELVIGNTPSLDYPWTGTEKKRFAWVGRFSAPKATPQDSASARPANLNYTTHLLSALIGLADADGDKKITARELFRQLGSVPLSMQAAANRFYLAVTNKDEVLGLSDEQGLATLKNYQESIFSPVIQLEAQPQEAFYLQDAEERSRAFYQDFVLMVQLGNLLAPKERCAAALLDSLLARTTSVSLRNHLIRRLAAALQDETQQALNAYLQVNSREINRRRRNSEVYKLYPAYLSKSIELLGEKHIMRRILLAKLNYFEGLVLRLEGVKENDSLKLIQALVKQEAALGYEVAGAFIYNELGVVQSYLHRHEAAQKSYMEAIEYSPTWSIPYVNLALTALEYDDLETAYRFAFDAIPLAPWNAGAYNTLGMVCTRQGRFDDAEKLYQRALRADPDLTEARYNLACMYALKGLSDIAVDWLRQAFESGFDDTKLLLSDTDLSSLRPGKGYRQLVEKFFPGLGH